MKMKRTNKGLVNRRSALAAGLGGAGLLAAPAFVTAQSSPPLAGKFASRLYMQFPRGEKVPTAVEAQGYSFPVEWYDTDNRAYTVDDLRGKITLVQFWRSRCHACHFEVPALDAIAPQLEGPNFRMIAIALMEDSMTDIQQFYSRHNVRNLRVYQDRDHLAFSQIAPAHPTAGVRATPTTVLIDAQGNYISAYSGAPGWEKPEGIRLLNWYMNNA